MPKKFLSDLTPGEKAETFAVLRKSELREYNGAYYLLLELGDRTGRLRATVWNESEAIARSLTVGDVIKVIGQVILYKEQPQIKVEAVRKALDGEFSPDDIFIGPKTPVLDLLVELDKLISCITNKLLRTLVEALVSEKGLVRKDFAQAPGGKLWHHSYRGGLLEHTVSVANICRFTGRQYPYVDADLLLTGAILHDIGKIQEYDYKTMVIDYSDEGRLKGHLVIGYEMVNRAIQSITAFPDELAKRVGHMILSHQGKRDFGSPVEPQTVEALLLYYADEMDSKAAAYDRILTETVRSNKKWSDFVPLIERYLYAGEQAKDASR